MLESLRTVSAGLAETVLQEFCNFAPHLADQPFAQGGQALRDMGGRFSHFCSATLGNRIQAAETELAERPSVPERSQPGADASGSSQAE